MSGIRLLVTGALLGGAFSPTLGHAATAATPDTATDSDTPQNITVTGVRSVTRDKLGETPQTAPQSIDVISHDLMEQQASSRLADALRNVPGITFNSGEGAARGDTVNLRGFSAFNDFFLDGIRDAAIYNRDSFNLDTVEVLEGPSAIVFGRGSTGGAINQVSKAPMLAPLWSASVVGGTNSEIRGTADVNQAIGPDAAIRINAMGERSKVTDRDLVSNHRWGVAPSIGLGLTGPDTLIVEYVHQEETDVPDVGIPFINGRPANVPRNLDYGLASDRFRSVVNIGTGYYRHKFSNDLIFSDTLRYGDYTNFDRFNAPNFGYDNTPGAPTATTPLSTVRVGRDSPSSSDHRTNLTNQTSLTAKFATGPLRHALVFGTEFSREEDKATRYVNPFGTANETPATSLLDPDPYEVSPVEPGKTLGVTTAYGSAAYLIDTISIGDMIDVIGGVRYDRFSAHYRPSALIAGVSASSLTPLDHVDHQWSPRASLVFKPNAHARIYASYGTSFDPSAEALSLSTKNANLAPVTAKSYELGAKYDFLGGKLLATAAIFRTQINNAQITDPDHPTQIQLAGNQRVDGAEVGLTGRVTAHWELTAGYTFLNGKTLYSTTPGATGSQLANTARNSANLWTEYEFSHGIELGVGGNYLDKRYGDYEQQATLPAYVIVNAMAAWTVNPQLLLRANVNNVFNKLAWINSYYTSAEENHVLPAPGRTALFTAVVKLK